MRNWCHHIIEDRMVMVMAKIGTRIEAIIINAGYFYQLPVILSCSEQSNKPTYGEQVQSNQLYI